MILHLMRHAQAVSPNTWKAGDAARPLSPRGREELASALPVMKNRSDIFKPALIVTSPYVRAYETATVMAQVLNGSEPLVEPLLASGARPDAFGRVIRQNKVDALLIVGHMPDLAQCAARLTGDIFVLERSVSPGEMLTLEMANEDPLWGRARLLWEKKLVDWR